MRAFHILSVKLYVVSGVGFIALAGVAAEFGAFMLLHLKHALQDRLKPVRASRVSSSTTPSAKPLCSRTQPKATTVTVVQAGPVGIVWGAGTG